MMDPGPPPPHWRTYEKQRLWWEVSRMDRDGLEDLRGQIDYLLGEAGYQTKPKRPDPPAEEPEGGVGVREPRRPLRPLSGAGAAADLPPEVEQAREAARKVG